MIEDVREDLRHPLYTVTVEGGAMASADIWLMIVLIAFLVIVFVAVSTCIRDVKKKRRVQALVLAVIVLIALVRVGIALADMSDVADAPGAAKDSVALDTSVESDEPEENAGVEDTTDAEKFAEDGPGGRKKVEFYGISLEDKQYDGSAVKLDMSRFLCSEVSIMDYTTLDYDIEVLSGGVDEDGEYVFNPGNLVYGALPKEPGTYRLTISIPRYNKKFFGEKVIEFTIAK